MGKKLFLLAAACIVLSIVFTETLAAESLDHDCIGEGCPVCLQISAANSFLETLKLAAAILFLAVCPAFPVLISSKMTQFTAFICSPVSFKVRFNS